MKNIKIGLFFGLAFGIVDSLLMLPIPMNDKALAIMSASINRFAIGYFVATTPYPKQGWLRGLLIGFILSLPDAIITKTYAPILGIGILGGLILGLFFDKLVRKL